MPQRPVRRRQVAPSPSAPYRPSELHASTRILCKLRDTHDTIAPSTAHTLGSAHLKQARGGARRRATLPPQPQATQTARVNHAYERLAAERALLTAAAPSLWFQRSIDRIAGANETVGLLHAYAIARPDVDSIEAELLRRPLSSQTANRWGLRLDASDVDRSTVRMYEQAITKAVSERDGKPYHKPMWGQIPVAGMRLAHASLRQAAWVDLSHKGLTDAHLLRVLPFLPGFEAIQCLDLSHNTITDASLAALGEALKSHASLILLDLRGNDISDAGVKSFNEQVMGEVPSLTLGSELQATDIRDPVQAMVTIEALRTQEAAVFEIEFAQPLRVACGRAKSGAEVVHALAQAPGTLRRFLHLDLSDKSWQNVDLQALADILEREGIRLTQLDLSGSTLADHGVHTLAQALRHAHALETLSLTGVTIDEAGDAALRELVQQTPTLTHVACCGAPLTDAALLARAVGGPGIKPRASSPVPTNAPPDHASAKADVAHQAYDEQPSLLSQEMTSIYKQIQGALNA